MLLVNQPRSQRIFSETNFKKISIYNFNMNLSNFILISIKNAK